MPKDEHVREPLLRSFADIKPEPISWLWEPYVPRRRITILEGDAGVGKTFLACKLAAMVSAGERWPWSASSARPRRGAAIIMSREDGLADTLRPRLELCGADLKRVHTLTEWKNTAQEGAITLKDIDVLERAFKAVKPALVVIDPLQAFIGADVHMGSANKTRPVLAALGALAERHDTAVVIVRHLTKGRTAKATYRGLGGVDFSAAVRSLLLAGKNPKTGEHAVVHLKSSAGPLGPSLGYRIDASGLAWTGVSNATAAQLLASDTASDDGDEARPRERAMEFLRDVLSD
ncbi:MAG: AAA family ATPase, partial [Planctomycetota bacterium]